MFLRDNNGNKLAVNLRAPAPKTVEKYTAPATKSEGSNKGFLYAALIIGLIVAIGSGYMIYKHIEKSNTEKKARGNFGYKLN